MEVVTVKCGAAPDVLSHSIEQESAARILENGEIKQIEQDKDPEEALQEDLDDDDAELEEGDELDEEAAVSRAAERNQI